MIIDHDVELLPIESRRSRSAEPAPVCYYLTSNAYLILNVPQHQLNMLMEAIRYIYIHQLNISMNNMVSCLHLFLILRILNHRKYEWIFGYFFFFFHLFIYIWFNWN